MTEPIRCPRCKRSFGGEQAYRRGHRRQGRPRRETCRRVTELRRSDVMWQDDEGVWRMRGPSTPGQLKLPLFGRGRPRKTVAIFSSRTRDGRTYVAKHSVRGRPSVVSLAA
jgi:hypothetical protein